MHKLPWLLTPPSNFGDRCAQLINSNSVYSDLSTLASYSLSINQANRLYRMVGKLDDSRTGELLQSFGSLKLGILSNATIDLMIPLMFTSALRHGIFLEFVTTDFDQVAQEAFDPNSLLNSSGVDIVLLALDYRAFPFAARSLTVTSDNLKAVDALDYVHQLRAAIRKNTGVNCIVQTLVGPPYPLLGNIDVQTEGLLGHEILKFNVDLASALKNDADLLLDVATLAANVGISNWLDERQWYLSRMPMANRFIALYTDRIACLLAAMRGLSKKCLVLDLDNTLWAGVIGDDGLAGIVVGQGSPLGESHLSLQRLALELKQRGVILAVCSKNEEANARLPFREHPHMLLRENDIAVFIANWHDKTDNIRSIAKQLNIGLDSIVFVDENPAEREMVRMILPEVAVPELPTDPALFCRVLTFANYFELISLTDEDVHRSEQYAQNAMRHIFSKTASSVEEYLSSLDMQMSITPFDKVGRKRIVQLINKTNQFNLTTRRYTEADVTEFEQSPNVITLQVSLTDRFGDNGMVSVLICKVSGKNWEIDTWLMSCRVIKRGVEFAVCDELVKQALSQDVEEIIGVYMPTKKNNLVSKHYMELGFKNGDNGGDWEVWTLDPAKYQFKSPQIAVTRN